MLEIAVYSQEGNKVKDTQLNENVFGIEPNNQAIFDMVLLQRASWRQGTASVKNRSAVRGGGKKPWRQKGTGRARQGTIRAPQWRGGGVVFGPQPRDYSFKLNKKVRLLALKSALSQKVIDSELTVLDKLTFETPKTKNMVAVLDTFESDRKSLIVLGEKDRNVELSARNIPGVKVVDSNGINVYDILDCNKMFVTEDALKSIEEVLG